MMARASRIARELLRAEEDAFLRAKIATARFYAEHILPRAQAYTVAITRGAGSVLELEDALL
jgi:hypothetical protein